MRSTAYGSRSSRTSRQRPTMRWRSSTPLRPRAVGEPRSGIERSWRWVAPRSLDSVISLGPSVTREDTRTAWPEQHHVVTLWIWPFHSGGTFRHARNRDSHRLGTLPKELANVLGWYVTFDDVSVHDRGVAGRKVKRYAIVAFQSTQIVQVRHLHLKAVALQVLDPFCAAAAGRCLVDVDASILDIGTRHCSVGEQRDEDRAQLRSFRSRRLKRSSHVYKPRDAA